ncbi:MAG: energy transducer TonB [Flavobacterium sp.]|uniref:energy transducer TonB n=1 Tax=unclassified Flavobacterium TaxID=196869 RepID=UPI000EB1377B|nr:MULTISPECIES: energy transducer TonB [unclassified Flavobacterium]MBA4135418.1 energy transducer TonB [Flavobacterium sp.]RKS01599.1 outer membrane transport energization protein TonB [Flavobacterium sp. 102]
MKLDLLKRQWIDIVFEGRNKAYGAYELRKENPKTTLRSLAIGAVIFGLAVSAPLIISLIPEGTEDTSLDQKIVTIKLPPKEKPPENLPPPPPPPPKQDQVKFVKPVVAKTEEIVEEPPKVEEIKDKKLGAETIKGDPDAPLSVEPVGTGPSVVEEDNNIYNTAGIEVKPDFPGGLEKFYKFIGKNFQVPEEDGLKGKIFVTFVVEKDGSLTDIKVIRDIGYGTGKEAIRVLKSCPRWNPGEQNGKKVRVLYSLPISIQSAE